MSVTAAIIALALTLAVAVPAGVAGWVTAYRQRDKRAGADLALQAERHLVDGLKTADEARRGELDVQVAIRRAADADVDQLAGHLDRAHVALASLASECSSCGAPINEDRDEVLRTAGAEVGLRRPVEVVP